LRRRPPGTTARPLPPARAAPTPPDPRGTRSPHRRAPTRAARTVPPSRRPRELLGTLKRPVPPSASPLAHEIREILEHANAPPLALLGVELGGEQRPAAHRGRKREAVGAGGHPQRRLRRLL